MSTRLLPLLVFCLSACRGHPDSLYGVQVTSARLEDVGMTTAAALGGFVTGRGTLVVTEPTGAVRAFPVVLTGGTVGAVFEIDVDGPGHENKADLILPEPVMLGNDLLGRYKGTSVSLALALGFDSLSLENKRGVVFDKNYFSIGAGVNVGFQWLRIDVDGAELALPQDTSAGYDTRSGGCSCQPTPLPPADTADPDTGAPGDTGDTGDTDATTPPADTDPLPTDTGPDEAAPTATTDSCDDGCSSAPVRVPWWGALLLAVWMRRRSAPSSRH